MVICCWFWYRGWKLKIFFWIVEIPVATFFTLTKNTVFFFMNTPIFLNHSIFRTPDFFNYFVGPLGVRKIGILLYFNFKPKLKLWWRRARDFDGSQILVTSGGFQDFPRSFEVLKFQNFELLCTSPFSRLCLK